MRQGKGGRSAGGQYFCWIFSSLLQTRRVSSRPFQRARERALYGVCRITERPESRGKLKKKIGYRPHCRSSLFFSPSLPVCIAVPLKNTGGGRRVDVASHRIPPARLRAHTNARDRRARLARAIFRRTGGARESAVPTRLLVERSTGRIINAAERDAERRTHRRR